MIKILKSKAYRLLRWSEKYAKTDMVYLAKGGFWLTIGQITSNAASLLLSIAFANLLTPEIYGTYRFILSVCGILAIPALAGIGTAVTQAVARNFEGSVLPAVKLKIRWGLLGGLAGLVAAGYYLYSGNHQLSICFLIAALFLPFMDAFSTYDAVLLGKKDFRRSTIYAVLSQIISVAALLGVMFFSKNIFLLVGAYFLSWTLLRLIFLIVTLKKFQLNKKIDQSTLSYGKHLSLMGIIGSIANYLDRLLLFHFLGPVEVAVYSMAIAPPEQLKSLIKNINVLAFPKLSEKYEREGNRFAAKLWPKMIRFFLLACLITAVYIIFAPLVYKIFFPRYVNAVLYSQIFALSLFTIIGSIPTIALQAQANKKKLYIFNTLSPIVQIILLSVFIWLWGVMGAIIARIISRCFTLLLSISLLSFNKRAVVNQIGETDFKDNPLPE